MDNLAKKLYTAHSGASGKPWEALHANLKADWIRVEEAAKAHFAKHGQLDLETGQLDLETGKVLPADIPPPNPSPGG